MADSKSTVSDPKKLDEETKRTTVDCGGFLPPWINNTVAVGTFVCAFVAAALLLYMLFVKDRAGSQSQMQIRMP